MRRPARGEEVAAAQGAEEDAGGRWGSGGVECVGRNEAWADVLSLVSRPEPIDFSPPI